MAGPDSKATAQRLVSMALQIERQGAYAEAAELYRKALKLYPEHPELMTNRGLCLVRSGRERAGLDLLRAADGMRPDHPIIRRSLAKGFVLAEEYENALPILEELFHGSPEDQDLAYELSLTYRALGRLKDAIGTLEEVATRLRLDLPALAALSSFYRLADDTEKEAETALKILDLRPRSLGALSTADYALRRMGDWSIIRPLQERFTEVLLDKNASRHPVHDAIRPFFTLSMTDKADVLLAAARLKASGIESRTAKPFLHQSRGRRQGPLKIGYLSSDFRDHAVMHVLAGVFQHHNQDRVTVHCYSGNRRNDEFYTPLIRQRSAAFRSIRNMPTRAAADIIYQDDLDLLIDLNGYTKGSMLEVMAYRPAPVQATFLGYAATTGAEFVDYLVADRIVAPPEHRAYYSERLAYHPVCFMPNDVNGSIERRPSRRADWNLPENAIVFSSFNQAYKIEPVRFKSWMEILGRVPDSVLWLGIGSDIARQNFRAQAAALGISADRLIFADRVEAKDDHLERLRHIDCALDTRIYNGHVTTVDMLTNEIPVLTSLGGYFMSRVSASMLHALDLSELIAESEEDYVNRAASLARDRSRLSGVRSRLQVARKQSPLFDAAQFTRQFETLCEAMVDQGRPSADRPHAPLEIV